MNHIEAMRRVLRTVESERDKYLEFGDEDGAPEEIYEAIAALRAAIEQAEGQEPVAWAHKGPLGFSFSEKMNEAYSIPLYCAPMTMDSEFIQIPVAYQYVYPDGEWRCTYGDPINGCKPITSRALYARKDGK